MKSRWLVVLIVFSFFPPTLLWAAPFSLALNQAFYSRAGVAATYGGTTQTPSLTSGTGALQISASISKLLPDTTYQMVAATPSQSTVNKVIYNYTGRMTSCGDGEEYGAATRGQLIWDTVTNDISGVFTFAVGAHKGVTQIEMSAQQVFVFKGANGREYTTIAIAQSTGADASFPRFESDQIRGRRYPVQIGATTLKVPKSMTDSELFVNQADSGEPVLVELKGTYALDIKASAASNAASESVAEAATRIKQSYLQKGYSDIDQ